VVRFYAPLDHQGPDDEIVYDFKKFGEEVELLKAGDDYTYCLLQCYKMCFYVQKMHQTEILKMKAEFSKDENGTIWFVFASQIGQRRCKGKEHIQHSQTQISEIN
jgi:hypothetical protein